PDALPISFVFGPERTGLENDDLTFCDALVTIPLNPEYMSLNMAQAVLLVAYQWYSQSRNEADMSDSKNYAVLDHLGVNDEAVADKKEIDIFLAHLKIGRASCRERVY